jgi:hypothetical protein
MNFLDPREAIEVLLDPARDFPFSRPAHRSAYLAALLTPIARHAFRGPAPLMLIDSNTRGTGKGMLCNVVGTALVGRDMSVMSYVEDPEEVRKRVTTIVMSGDQVALFDNVSGLFGNSALDAMLTSTIWSDRILGANSRVELPCTVTWYATGNNVQIKADTARRVLHIRLDTLEEHPEMRSDFFYPRLLEHVRAERPKILSAAVSILRGYILAGMPDPGLRTWGSFEDWNRLVCGAILWAGQPDPGDTREELQAQSDTESDALGQILSGWGEISEALGGECTVAAALSELQRKPLAYSVLREVLTDAASGRPITAKGIGCLLRKFKNRVVDGRTLSRGSGRGRDGVVWSVTKGQSKNP